MRDGRGKRLFSHVDVEGRVPARHPLRMIRQGGDEALALFEDGVEALWTDFGRPPIPPERLIGQACCRSCFRFGRSGG